MYKWFENFEKERLMEFSLIPHKRDEAYIGQYFISYLEITLANNKTVLLQPIAAVTTEYDGKLEFSMLGNLNKKVNVLREILDKESHRWIMTEPYENLQPVEFSKIEVENLINKWLA